MIRKTGDVHIGMSGHPVKRNVKTKRKATDTFRNTEITITYERQVI